MNAYQAMLQVLQQLQSQDPYYAEYDKTHAMNEIRPEKYMQDQGLGRFAGQEMPLAQDFMPDYESLFNTWANGSGDY
jgi:hypothetical protein